MKLILYNQKRVLVPLHVNPVALGSNRLVYEVVRVIQRKALFLEDHYLRLKKSIESFGTEIRLNYQEFANLVHELIVENQMVSGNIKIVTSSDTDLDFWEFSVIPFRYPSGEDYKNGVKTALYFAEREDPNAKVLRNSFRAAVDQFMAQHHLYEVLLVDHHKKITEGSRSNVFFVKDRVVYTASAQDVLIGITRQKVIECIHELGYECVEHAVNADELSGFDAVFLTGTSPKVLPVCSVGEFTFEPSNQLVQRLMLAYDLKIENYLGRAT